MSLSFSVLCQKRFPTSRPIDFQTRTAAALFQRAIERLAHEERVSLWASQIFRRAVDRRSPDLLRMARRMIAGLGGIHERTAADLRRATELLEAAETDRELALLDRQEATRLAGAR